MSTETCVNHPDRAAIEHCEVCNDALCAYCLYYTNDGQRLCKTHAQQAEAAGAFIRAPGAYSGGLVSSQIDASRQSALKAAYEGDAVDVLALLGLLFGVFSLMMCFPPALCLVGPIGLIGSLFALITAKDARDPVRTRTMAGIGMTLSSLWLLVLAACIIAYLAQASIFTTVLGRTNFVQITVVAPQVIPQNAPTSVPPTATPGSSQ